MQPCLADHLVVRLIATRPTKGSNNEARSTTVLEKENRIKPELWIVTTIILPSVFKAVNVPQLIEVHRFELVLECLDYFFSR